MGINVHECCSQAMQELPLTLTWNTSRCPCSTAFCRCANLSTRSLTWRLADSHGFKRSVPGVTVYLSELPGLMLTSTLLFSVLVMVSVWQ